jgi:hypothetical protein
MSLGTGDDAEFVGWNIICGVLCAISRINSFPVIRGFAVRVTPISTNKKHAINTLKMAALLRSNVMQSYGNSGYFGSVRLVEP